MLLYSLNLFVTLNENIICDPKMRNNYGAILFLIIRLFSIAPFEVIALNFWNQFFAAFLVCYP